MSDVILLEGIQIPAALGVTAAERRVRRPVTLDLEIGLDLREAGRVDRIGRTVHYKRIFELVEDVAANQEHQLVEALGDRIARVVLSKFDVDFVTVTVRKPTPIAGVLQYAGRADHANPRGCQLNLSARQSTARNQGIRNTKPIRLVWYCPSSNQTGALAP